MTHSISFATVGSLTSSDGADGQPLAASVPTSSPYSEHASIRPDVRSEHLKTLLKQLASAADAASREAARARTLANTASHAHEKSAKYADQVGSLPADAGVLPAEAFGEPEGFFPPRYRWGTAVLLPCFFYRPVGKSEGQSLVKVSSFL